MKDNEAAATQPERRDDTRLATRGEIALQLKHGDAHSILRGRLVDMSTGGFRLRHQNRELRTGDELQASYVWGEVTVRVIWTRVVAGEQLESGFGIVTERGEPSPRLMVGLKGRMD